MEPLTDLSGHIYPDALTFNQSLEKHYHLSADQKVFVIESAAIDEMLIESDTIASIESHWLSPPQKEALQMLSGRHFVHRWQLEEALAQLSAAWRTIPGEDEHNEKLANQLAYLYKLFRHDRTQFDQGL